MLSKFAHMHAHAYMHAHLQANFIGLPAISVPVGSDSKGLPIGLQLLGKAWREGTLLK